ncbi:MAG: helix-turn-helix transcriptional regulator [Anaerolineales bacterium]|jgi:putative transcriptional regulator
MIKNQVRKARLAKELTQEALAQEVDVSRQTIIALEKGNYTPSVKLALQLAHVLDKTVEDLFRIVPEE